MVSRRRLERSSAPYTSHPSSLSPAVGATTSRSPAALLWLCLLGVGRVGSQSRCRKLGLAGCAVASDTPGFGLQGLTARDFWERLPRWSISCSAVDGWEKLRRRVSAAASSCDVQLADDGSPRVKKEPPALGRVVASGTASNCKLEHFWPNGFSFPVEETEVPQRDAAKRWASPKASQLHH